ncbi:hypothetical protein ACWEOE_39880 [Amycolatopsis sp. NPDC004368]
MVLLVVAGFAPDALASGRGTADIGAVRGKSGRVGAGSVRSGVSEVVMRRFSLVGRSTTLRSWLRRAIVASPVGTAAASSGYPLTVRFNPRFRETVISPVRARFSL